MVQDIFKMNKKEVITKLVELSEMNNIKYDLEQMKASPLHGLRMLLVGLLNYK